MMDIKRGDIFYVNRSESVGSEQRLSLIHI